jgi:hypothetical protein
MDDKATLARNYCTYEIQHLQKVKISPHRQELSMMRGRLRQVVV